MAARMRNLIVLLAAACLALVLSGCVMIKATGTSQSGSMGPLTLAITGCVGGSPSCSGESNTGNPYDFIQGGPDEPFPTQVLLAMRLPAGSAVPGTLKGSFGAAALNFNRNESFETALRALEPEPAGERWWGWISDTVTYSKNSANTVAASLSATLPRPDDGGPFASPMRWRPTLGVRYVSGTLPASRPVNCGNSNKQLYEGVGEGGSGQVTTVCVDSPTPAAARGFLEATLTDFGIVGTTVQAPAGSTVTAPFLAKRSGPADPVVSFSLAVEGGVPGGSVSIDRSSVSLGGDATQPVLATIAVPPDAQPGTYPVTLTASASGKPTRSGTVTVMVPGEAPSLTKVSLKPKRFRARPGRGSVPVGTKLRFTLSEQATVTLQLKRLAGKRRKAKTALQRAFPKGATTLSFKKRIGKVKLAPGRYRLTLSAQGASGQSSEPKSLKFTFLDG